MSLAQPEEHVEHAEEAFDAGEVILEHIANSDIAPPLLHMPTVAGIDFDSTGRKSKKLLNAKGLSKTLGGK